LPFLFCRSGRVAGLLGFFFTILAPPY